MGVVSFIFRASCSYSDAQTANNTHTQSLRDNGPILLLLYVYNVYTVRRYNYNLGENRAYKYCKSTNIRETNKIK
jgi:hypothetical protein